MTRAEHELEARRRVNGLRAGIAVSVLAAGLVAIGGAPAAAADACPNDALRTGESANLPGCRAYERISPADLSNGIPGVSNVFTPQMAKAAASGDRFVYYSTGPLGDVERGGYNSINLARRTVDGWRSFGAVTTADPDVNLDLGGQAPAAAYPSTDLSRVGFRTGRGLGGPNPGTNNGGALYVSAPNGTGAPTWLSQPTIAPYVAGSNSVVIGGSPDLSTAYFTFNNKLTDLYGDQARATNGNGIYMSRDGVLTPAGRLPSGLVDPGGAIPAGSGVHAPTSTDLSLAGIRNQVSEDGSRLLFVLPAAGAVRQLYVQVDGGPGMLISKDVHGNPSSSGVTDLAGSDVVTDDQSANVPTGGSWYGSQDQFAVATRDGSKVFFRSTAALVAGAPADTVTKTYRATITDSAVTLEYLPRVNGLPMAVNADGTRVFFIQRGTGPNQIDLAYWDEQRPGGLPYVLASGVDGGFSSPRVVINQRVTPDGTAVMFESGAEIVPGTPMVDQNMTQIYRWELGDARPTCISCRTDGQPFGRFGARSANVAKTGATDNIASPLGRSADGFNQSTLSYTQGISDDGRRVFFDAIDPLDPARDTNGQRDVYMWEDGQLHLITSGKGTAPSFLLDSSASGDDVFFVTRDNLVPDDGNDEYDVYTARVGGGFAPKVAPNCVGEQCQPPSGPLGDLPGSGSSLLSPVTVGKQDRLPSRSASSLRLSRGKSTTTRAVLKVRTPTPGKIRVNGRGLRTTNRTAKRATTYTVKVPLSSRSRATLSAKGRVKLKLRVRFTPSNGKAVTKTASVTIKRTVRTKGKGR